MPSETESVSQDVVAKGQIVIPAAVNVSPKVEVEVFLERILEQLGEAPATTRSDQTVKIELPVHEVGYFYAMLKRLKAAEARKQRAYYKRSPSLEALIEKEQRRDRKTHPKPFITEPPGSNDPGYGFEQARLQEALSELPESLRKMAAALVDAEGNVSELARRMSQPQRKTARQVEKIRQHLRDRGLESLEF